MLNGHLPEGAKVVTLDMLRAANTKYVKAPVLSERAGEDVYVRIRSIRQAEYIRTLPPAPPGAEKWPQVKAGMSSEEREAITTEQVRLTNEWAASLSEDERRLRRKATDDVTYRVLEIGMIEPRVTFEAAQSLGLDADVIALEILVFSGLADAPAAPSAPVVPVAADAEAKEPAGA
jgi:hypothetical protein